MFIFKCKMCGGTIEFNQGDTVGVCDSCGTKQTLPRLDDDRKANLYDRANHFRRNNEFDKAATIYEQILNEDTADAEAYWSLVLCNYGIEYVEDPSTHKRIPTVNRAQFTSIFDDDNYKLAIKYADVKQRELYENEAKIINDIQKGILDISQKEEPFDVFICYKETDNNGRRTNDSVLANELYHQLIQEGFNVFFARITLEDKLGTAYEPYIFAALNSAKVMVVLGTKPEYFNAVWVKNEWSRYLSIVKKSGGRKVLIPAFKDMDPYDLPDEFSHLQAQDMSKLGFMQDLIRGIKKIVQADVGRTSVKEPVIISGGNKDVAPLLERAFIFLEDGKWEEADAYCEKVLDIDPKNPEAYLGKLMSELKVKNRKQLNDLEDAFDGNDNYKKVLKFADEKLKSEMYVYVKCINERNEKKRINNIYTSAIKDMSIANDCSSYMLVAEKFKSISGYENADELARECEEKAEISRIEEEHKKTEKAKTIKKLKITIALVSVLVIILIIVLSAVSRRYKYNKAIDLINNKNYEEAADILVSIEGYDDAEEIYKTYIPINIKVKLTKVGSYIKFGTYEQDNNTSNGREDIEWIVLAKEDNRALIVSKYVLDRMRYNNSNISITWETCSLRKWLNGTFFKTAFNQFEENSIINTNVISDKYPTYGSPGNNTVDKVFLLSVPEINKYFVSKSKLCLPTKYAMSKGLEENCYWLRSPGISPYTASYVDNENVVEIGTSVSSDRVGIRPAIWVEY